MLYVRNGATQFDTHLISQLDRGGRGRIIDPSTPILIIVNSFDGAIIDLLGRVIIVLIDPFMFMSIIVSAVIIVMTMFGEPTMGPGMRIGLGNWDVKNQSGSDDKSCHTHPPFLSSKIHEISFLLYG